MKRKKINRPYCKKAYDPMDDFTMEGLHYTSEAWRCTLDPDRRLLAFTCLHNVFTREQAVRYLCNGDLTSAPEVHQANEVLNRRTGQQQWFCSVNFVFQSGAVRTLAVYYLTQHALVELRKFVPALTRFASPSRPFGVHYERIPHEIDVVEAHLHYISTGEVLEFLNEKELKRKLQKARYERLSRGESNTVSEATGDFQILIVKKPDRGIRLLCEVATANMKAAQVKTKPDGMIWFTQNLHRRDVIAEIKGSETPVIMLVDPISRHIELLKALTNLAGSKAPQAPHPRLLSTENLKLTPREKRVLHALERLGGAATTEAIAAFLGVKRAGISTCMNQLARKKVLRSEGACLCAERDLGTPTLIYMRGEHRLASENFRRHRLIVSLILIEFTLQGFRFCSYDTATGALEMRHTTDPILPRQVIVADNHEVDLAALRQRIMRARGGIRDGKQLVVAMTDRSRMKELREMDVQIKIVDVSREARHEIETRDEAA